MPLMGNRSRFWRRVRDTHQLFLRSCIVFSRLHGLRIKIGDIRDFSNFYGFHS